MAAKVISCLKTTSVKSVYRFGSDNLFYNYLLVFFNIDS